MGFFPVSPTLTGFQTLSELVKRCCQHDSRVGGEIPAGRTGLWQAELVVFGDPFRRIEKILP